MTRLWERTLLSACVCAAAFCQSPTPPPVFDLADVHVSAPSASAFHDHPVIDSTGLEGGWDFVLSRTAGRV